MTTIVDRDVIFEAASITGLSVSDRPEHDEFSIDGGSARDFRNFLIEVATRDGDLAVNLNDVSVEGAIPGTSGVPTLRFPGFVLEPVEEPTPSQ